MRNFVILVILGLGAWWGYSNWWVPSEAKEGARSVDSQPGEDHGQRPDHQESGEEVPGGEVLPAANAPTSEAQAQSRRLVQALRAQDYAGVEVDAGLESKLIGDPAGLYALQVGLALARADGPSAALVRSADAVAGKGRSKGVAEGPELLCAGLSTLVGKDRPEAALEALGSENGFLGTRRAKASEAALDAYLDGMSSQDREDVVLYLSSLVTRMTRGEVDVWNGSGFAALRKAVGALYGILDQVLLSPEGLWRSSYVTVRNGDTLDAITNRFEKKTRIPVSPGLIQLVNGIQDAKRIHPGQRLRVPRDRMEIVVTRRTYTMRVYLGDLLLRVYQVGHGKEGHETPVGDWKVIEKQLDPVWYHPNGGRIPPGDPRNLLGHYFIKLSGPRQGFGIHGTVKQSTVGTRSSLGCIRVRNNDMAKFFAIVPRKTLVRVED